MWRVRKDAKSVPGVLQEDCDTCFKCVFYGTPHSMMVHDGKRGKYEGSIRSEAS